MRRKKASEEEEVLSDGDVDDIMTEEEVVEEIIDPEDLVQEFPEDPEQTDYLDESYAGSYGYEDAGPLAEISDDESEEEEEQANLGKVSVRS